MAKPWRLRTLPILAVAAVAASACAREDEYATCRPAPALSKTDKFNFTRTAEQAAFASSLSGDKVIGRITFTRYNVFNQDDPREANWLYRLANRFNVITRESVIQSQLMFAEGDPYNPAALAESERLLRALVFLYDAQILPVRVCGDLVDLEVVTRDIWTLSLSLSLSRSGGDNTASVGIADSNLLGSGKRVAAYYLNDPDRSGYTLLYDDPALFASRWNLHAAYSDNSDGYLRSLLVQRPFFSVYEVWSAGADAAQGKLEDATWFRGDEVTEFNRQYDVLELFGGFAPHPEEGERVARWRGGIHYETNSFSYSDSSIPPADLPADRDYVYPFFGYESTEDQFRKVSNMNFLGRTEDLYTGERYHWSLGWSGAALGASRNQLALDGLYENTLWIDQRSMWRMQALLNGFVGADNGDFENLWLTLATTYFYRQHHNWTFFSHLRIDYTEGLTSDRQVLLGGDNGLRGYDRNYQVGDRSFVVNLEERYYSDLHLFRLLRVGGAMFLDVGRTWYTDRDNGANGGVLADVGVGLRLHSSRAAKQRVFHVDLAFPLARGDDVDSVQLLFKVRERF